MERNSVDEDEIMVNIRLLDNEIHRQLAIGSRRDKSTEMIAIGAVLTCLGASVTIGTFTGVFNTVDSFLILYGPI